jgi:hypothetical protein
MAKLVPRYSKFELETLRLRLFPEERRSQFTHQPWSGEGFRHYLDPKIVCIEHFHAEAYGFKSGQNDLKKHSAKRSTRRPS